MASTSGGSFIPKRSTGRVTPVRAGKRIYVFSYIAYVLFFGTLLSVVGIFFLNQQAKSNLAEYVSLVAEQRKAFNNRDQIETIKSLDSRLIFAERILSWHAAPSQIFEELESVVVETVQLDSLTYERETGKGVKLEFGGLTESFDALLFQRDVMSRGGLLAEAEIVDVSFGVAGTEVEGANRGGAQSSNASLGEATVTFTFSDETIVEKIGYQPRLDTITSQPDLSETDAAEVANDTEILEDDSIEGNDVGQ